MSRALSFDVFDTLLTRRVASPTSLFLILARRAAEAGHLQISPEAFREHRIAAEEDTRSRSGAEEISFDDIYHLLAARLDLTMETRAAIANLELQIESEMITVVPDALERLATARSRCRRIIFISDMYLPTEFVRSLLAKNGLLQSHDALYVSSAFKKTKHRGGLFNTVLQSERLKPKELRHTGDHPEADVTVPNALGIPALHFSKCQLNRYEQCLESFAGESHAFTSLIAGAARLTRLKTPVPSKHQAILRDVAASVVCPTITLYAFWLLRAATEQKIAKLYFVARDGYLVKKVADALIKMFRLPIETHYLYGSRQAWHLPALACDSDPDFSWLFEQTRTLTIRIILRRVGTCPEDISSLLSDSGWPEKTWDLQLDCSSLAALRSALLTNEQFIGLVRGLAVARQETALKYFEQSGLKKGPWALVDLGWHGRLQASLQKLLGMGQNDGVKGFYLGLYRDSPALSAISAEAMLPWDLRSPPPGMEVPDLVFLLESFCTAPHGSTIGYELCANGGVRPQLRNSGFSALQKWGVDSVHTAVDTFAETLANVCYGGHIPAWDPVRTLVPLLRLFSADPLPEEARAWGLFPYEDEQGGVVLERLTVPYSLTWRNLKAAWTFGDERFFPSSWRVLWHGAQPHMRSWCTPLLTAALGVGRLKRRLGRLVRKRRAENERSAALLH